MPRLSEAFTSSSPDPSAPHHSCGSAKVTIHVAAPRAPGQRPHAATAAALRGCCAARPGPPLMTGPLTRSRETRRDVSRQPSDGRTAHPEVVKRGEMSRIDQNRLGRLAGAAAVPVHAPLTGGRTQCGPMAARRRLPWWRRGSTRVSTSHGSRRLRRGQSATDCPSPHSGAESPRRDPRSRGAHREPPLGPDIRHVGRQRPLRHHRESATDSGIMRPTRGAAAASAPPRQGRDDVERLDPGHRGPGVPPRLSRRVRRHPGESTRSRGRQPRVHDNRRSVAKPST